MKRKNYLRGLMMAMIVVATIFIYHHKQMFEFSPIQMPLTHADSVRIHNEACYEECKEDILICIAYVEGFREKPYFCGARWTVGYGTTVYPDGSRVKKDSPIIDKNYAKECVFSLLDKHVKPFILAHVERRLTHDEMLGIELFIYNVGGEQFSGYNKDGEVVGEASEFLKAINRDDNALETAKKMTSFRKSAGKRANGLLKRHWVVAGIYTGIISPLDILELQPEMFYRPDVAFYYDEMKGNFWEYNFRNSKVLQFIQNNLGKDSVREII